MRHKIRFSDYIRKNWLLVGIIVCIILSLLNPHFGAKNGPLKPELTVKYGAVSLIFFISGLSLKSDSIYHTLEQKRLHCFIQLFTFIFIPIFIQLLILVLNLFQVNPWILKGLITAACMPPPVSSAVILTRAAQGNEIAAIFNSVIGSFLGILITPLLLLINLGYTTVIPLLDTIVQLSLTVLFPLFAGQLIRKYTYFRGHSLPLNSIGQCALLFVIYTTFCDTFQYPEAMLSASDVLVTVFLVVLIQMVLMGISFSLGKRFRKYYSAEDLVAIMFCSTHKSLTLGIPILRIMFQGYMHLSQISLPLLVYHPTQIIIGGLLVMHLKDWVQLQKNRRPPV